MTLAAQICAALSALGVLLVLGSMLVGMTSTSRYTDESCGVVFTIGGAIFILFGGLALALRYG